MRFSTRARRLVRAACLVALAASTLGAGAAGAAIFSVSKTTDTDDGACNQDCSLREAIAEANARPGADEIHLPKGTYRLTIAGANEDGNATGDLDVSGDVTIIGGGKFDTTVDAQRLDRVFDVLGGAHLKVRGLEVTGGGGGVNRGGGIRAVGRLTIENCFVAGNVADIDGGGVYSPGSGSLTVRDATILNNQAGHDGGGIFTATSTGIHRTTINGNEADTGGGLVTLGDTTIVNSTITGNQNTVGSGRELRNFGDLETLNVTFHSQAPGPVVQGDASIANESGASIVMTNTIVDVDDAALPLKGCSGSGSFGTGGGNLESPNDTCGFTDPTDRSDLVDGGLEPLGNNGGQNTTHALKDSSAALDGGLNSACPTEDQRSSPRPTDGDGDLFVFCDIGAYEHVICPDLDDDGYSTGGLGCGKLDCDDLDPDVNPGVNEVCGNGVDDNCKNGIDEDIDEDNDGYTTCDVPEPDCDDNAGSINPGQTEIPDNGIDEDCDPATPACGSQSVVFDPYGEGIRFDLGVLTVPAALLGIALLRRRRRASRR